MDSLASDDLTKRDMYAMLPTSEMPVALQYTMRARGSCCCSANTVAATLVPVSFCPAAPFFALWHSSNTWHGQHGTVRVEVTTARGQA